MSLKAIHILFIIVSTMLCFGFAAWAFWTPSGADQSVSRVNLVMGSCSLVLGLGLLVYGRYFLKKLKDVSYL
ncbi:MAG: hypothetical protein JNN07_26320 [Verrucomicrobiales bacterium]|jgi:hypothetical protein|nr:hypothetical protein [Verrucomicrobiales bacterium]